MSEPSDPTQTMGSNPELCTLLRSPRCCEFESCNTEVVEMNAGLVQSARTPTYVADRIKHTPHTRALTRSLTALALHVDAGE